MPDVLYVLVTVGMFVRTHPGGPGSRAAVSATNLVGLIIAVLMTAFLVAALLFPERF